MNLIENEKFQEIEPRVISRFLKYHAENPKIYTLFKKFANEAMLSGRPYFGGQMIMERLRWYVNVETTGDIFKINNDYASCYSRLLMLEDERFKYFFRTRSTQKRIQS